MLTGLFKIAILCGIFKLQTALKISCSNDNDVQEFKSESGEILSYNYPQQYTNDLKCYFRIKVDTIKKIVLDFKVFRTETGHDRLMIYDGDSVSDPLIGNFSGTVMPPPIISSSNQLLFFFRTDGSVVDAGFKLNYKTIKNKKFTNWNLTNSEGNIQSPGFPNNYTPDESCTWTILAPTKHLITLEFNSFETETIHDFLEIIEVSDNRKILAANYSGTDKPNRFLSTTNQIILNFTSDQNNERKGFNISYKFIKTGSYVNLIIQTPYSLVYSFDSDRIEEVFHPHTKNFDMSMLMLSLEANHASYYNSYLSLLYIESYNGTDFKFVKKYDSVGSVVYDWIHNLLIWTDIQNTGIKVIDLNKTDDEYVFDINMLHPNEFISNELLINTQNSVLLWTVIGSLPRIIESNFDGSNQSEIYSNSKQVFHLTADYGTQRYYFIDITDFSLYSIDFSGKDERLYFKSINLFDSINNMFVSNNELYLSNSQMVYKIPDLDIKLNRAEILYKSYDFYKTQQLFPALKDPEFFEINSKVINRSNFEFLISLESKTSTPNKCSQNQCSHLCLPIGNSYRCVCPSNHILVNDTECLEREEESEETTTLQNESITQTLQFENEYTTEPQLEVQTTSKSDKTSTMTQFEITINDAQTEVTLQDHFTEFFNTTVKSYIGLDELEERLNLFKQEHLNLEYSCNSNKFGVFNFILIAVIITSNVIILYFAHKKIKSIENFYCKPNEGNMPLLDLDSDYGKGDTMAQKQNLIEDNDVFTRC